MAKRKTLKEKEDPLSPFGIRYIETPIKVFYGGKDKVIYPHILAILIIGAILGATFLQ